MDDPEKIKSIEGITGIWCEEFTEFSRDDWLQLDLRLRGNPWAYKQLIGTFNPIQVTSWIAEEWFGDDSSLMPTGDETELDDRYKRIIDKQGEAVCAFQSNYDDNPFLDEPYLRRLRGLADVDEYFHRVYTLGLWGHPKGLILRNWRVTDAVSTDPEYYDQVSAGADFGYNDPATLIRTGMKDGVLHIFGEPIFQTELITKQLVEEYRTAGLGPRERVIADSAGTEPIQAIRRERIVAGIRACEKYPNMIADDIDYLLSLPEILIHPSCVNTIREFGSWKWREDRKGRILEEPVAYDDHAIDAIRYATQRYRRAKATGGGLGYSGRSMKNRRGR